MSRDLRFTKHFDTLVALITHLSSTDDKSQTPGSVADALGLQKDEVEQVLGLFPGFFRKSKSQSEGGEHFFAVHLRYARRAADGETSNPLTPGELTTLLSLVSHMTSQEHETSLLLIEMKEEHQNIKQTNRITLIVALVSAFAAVIAATIGIMAGNRN